jgi:ABC-type Mn2+/Zn2+ transport system permease subunit
VDTIVNHIADPFQYGFMARALIASVLVGVLCPLLGGYVVTRGYAFMGDALSHAILPGVIAAFMVGVSPFVGSIPTGIAVALLIGFLVQRTGVSEDTSIGILFAGLFAAGLVLLSVSSGLSVNLEDLLLGQVLGVSTADILVTVVLAALVVLLLFLFHKEMVFTSFDPVGARVVGLPTKAIDYLLLALLALVIIVSVQTVGIVLVMAMLVTPAATAYLLAGRFTGVMVLGAVLGVGSAVTGLYLSYYFDLPSGAAMTLVATGAFATAALFKRKAI